MATWSITPNTASIDGNGLANIPNNIGDSAIVYTVTYDDGNGGSGQGTYVVNPCSTPPTCTCNDFTVTGNTSIGYNSQSTVVIGTYTVPSCTGSVGTPTVNVGWVNALSCINGTVYGSVTGNTSTSSRSGTLTLPWSGGGLSCTKTATFTQEGKPSTPTCDDATRTDYAFNNFNANIDYGEVSNFIIATSKKQDNPFDPTPDPDRPKLTLKEAIPEGSWFGGFSSGVYNPWAYAYALSASSNTTTETRSGSVILVSPEGCEFEATFTQKALNCDSITSDVANKIRATGGTSQQIGSVNIIDGCIVLTAYTDDNWVTNITSVTASTSQGTTYNFRGDIAASTPTTGSETARTTTLHVNVQLPNGSECMKDITVTQYVQHEVSVSAITDMGTIDCDKYQKITIKFSESVTLRGQFYLSGGNMTYIDFTTSSPSSCVSKAPRQLIQISFGPKDGTMSEFDYTLPTTTQNYTIYSPALPTIIYNDNSTTPDKYHFTLVYANY